MTDREVMQMALEALIASHPIANTDKSLDKHSETMSALRQALAQGEQAPVAFRKMAHGMWFYIENKPSPPNDDYEPLYTAPPSKPWQSLTDEEKAEIFQADWNMSYEMIDIAEAKLKEKNNG